jgi:hypothetical protein
MALITVADIATATRMTIAEDTPEWDQAQFFCDQVTAYITDMIGFLFDETAVSERLQADYDGIITLTKKPVSSVTSVKTFAGSNISSFYWNGLDEIDGLEAHQVVDVEYVAGFSEAPAILKPIAVAAASRQMLNPNGIRQQTVGAISETFAAPGAYAGSVFFTEIELKVLSKYMTTMDTWHIGPRTPSARLNNLPIL